VNSDKLKKYIGVTCGKDVSPNNEISAAGYRLIGNPRKREMEVRPEQAWPNP
jgi:hypothetical protein